MNFQPKRLTGYSEEDVIQEIRRVVLEECGGVVPSRTQFARVARIWLTTICKKFGSYEQAIRKAGFDYTDQHARPRAKYTIENIKASLREVLKHAGGRAFSRRFYLGHEGCYSERTIKSVLRVKTWREVLEAIDVKKQPCVVHLQKVSAHAQRLKAFANLTQEDLINEIGRVWHSKARRPTYAEFRQASQYGISIYESRFGSWRKAVEAFSKARNKRAQGKAGTWATKEVLLDELRSVQRKRPGDLLTYDFYKANGGTYSRGAFSNHFGNWLNAVKAVGGISGRQARYSKDELFDEIQRLWEKFGRQPTYNEMRSKEGNFNPSCYVNMFGSWTKALYAFCEDRDSDSVLPHHSTFKPSSVPRTPTKPNRKEPPAVIPSKQSAPLVVIHTTVRSVPKRLRWRVFARDGFTCKGCGRSPTKHGIALEADHILAWDKGGETVLENLQTLCEDCNSGKSNL